MANELVWTVLPTTHDVLPGTELSEAQRKRGLRDLKDQNVAAVYELGCLLPAVPRLRFTEEALAYSNLAEEQRSWLGSEGLGNLVLFDFAKIEAVNDIAPLYATKGWSLTRVQFYERQPMIAAAEYVHSVQEDPAYMLFCWASRMETQRELFERFEALEEAMTAEAKQAQYMGPEEKFRPSGVALVGASEWGAARALCLAYGTLSGWVEPGSITGWYHDSAGWHVSNGVSAVTGAAPKGMPPLRRAVYDLRPSMSTRQLGTQNVENILAGSLYAGRGSQKLIELLSVVALYPCGAVAHYQRLMGEKRRGNETRRRMKILEEKGLVEVVTKRGRAMRRKGWGTDIPVTLSNRGQGQPRYAATLAGRVAFCYVHGGRPQDLFSRTKLGRLKTVVRERILLQLWTLSWTVHLRYARWLRPVDGSTFSEITRGQWKDLREGALVHLLTLACMLHLNESRRRKPTDAIGLKAMARIWARLREVMGQDHWLYQHEDIVYEILGQLREAGCAFDAGWQARTTLADGRRIDPDAVVQVWTPWGRWWCYLEVELSDRTEIAVQPRCDKYGSTKRRDNLPVLIVCRDEVAEKSFHKGASGSERPPRMLTTTLSRLKEGGFFGPKVWSRHSERVTLAP